jgi:hypothetical protein
MRKASSLLNLKLAVNISVPKIQSNIPRHAHFFKNHPSKLILPLFKMDCREHFRKNLMKRKIKRWFVLIVTILIILHV